MFKSASFTKARNWKQPKCPSTDGILTVIKRIGASWAPLKTSMLSERSKIKLHVLYDSIHIKYKLIYSDDR